MNLGPELLVLVERLRTESREHGDLLSEQRSAGDVPLPPEAGAVLKPG